MLQPLAAERRISLTLPAEGEGHHALADYQRTRQVLLNLLSNAIKYNREGGRVTVSCTPVDGGIIRTSVADTGPGMTPEKLARMFTPFDRLGAEATTITGTGLGLALSKRLVEAMHGQIGVESQPGAGSTFWVDIARFGRAEERPRGRSPSPGATAHAGGCAHGPLHRGQLLQLQAHRARARPLRRIDPPARHPGQHGT